MKEDLQAFAYTSYLQGIRKRPPFTMYFNLRTVGNPLDLAVAVRKAVREIAPGVPA